MAQNKSYINAGTSHKAVVTLQSNYFLCNLLVRDLYVPVRVPVPGFHQCVRCTRTAQLCTTDVYMEVGYLSFARSNRKIIALNTRHFTMPFDLKSCKIMSFDFPPTSPGEKEFILGGDTCCCCRRLDLGSNISCCFLLGLLLHKQQNGNGNHDDQNCSHWDEKSD